MRASLMFACILFAGHAAADTTLSVVELAKALQNPDLAGDSPDAARAVVAALLVNQPVGEAEAARHHARLAELARYKDTRLGQIFFRTLETVPDVEQLPEGATSVDMLVRRPMGLDAVARVHVEWRLTGEQWKVARLDVYLEGAAAAPVVKAAPYFAEGPAMAAFFDREELDYLVGRDPVRRNRPDGEAFDFAAGLENCLKAEAGAYEALITRLSKGVNPRTDRPARLAALKPHLPPDGQEAMEKADADPTRRDKFWEAMFERLKAAEKAPRPVAVPARRGSELRITVKDKDGVVMAATEVQRLPSGEIAPRILEAGNGAKGD